MNILADASLPHLHTLFPPPFTLTLYHNQNELPSLLNNKTILLCRSTLKVNEALLNDSSLQYVATASSGIDHIDEAYLRQRGIVLIDAKGSNATAVANYVLSSLAFLKKSKGFKGKTAGVIGVGQVGYKVTRCLKALGMDVFEYDPPKASREPCFQSCSLNDLMDCDLISIHANLHDTPPYPSAHLIDKQIIKQLKTQSAIINASRGGIVSERSLLDAHYQGFYCTDVYCNEPDINPSIVQCSTLCTPHIAGHSIEAKHEAVRMISQALHQHYHLPCPPKVIGLNDETETLSLKQDWPDQVLSLYNPIHETEALKQAHDLTSAFLTIRRAHTTRHDFKIEP